MGKNKFKKAQQRTRNVSVYFGTWQLKQIDFYERMASWREEYDGLSLNGPGVTVTNSTAFCFW